MLIVIAITAFPAATAVPSFLRAQTRAKGACSTADIRTVALALESDAVHTNKHPVEGHSSPKEGKAY